MDDQSRELGKNNPRRRAQELRAQQAAAEQATAARPASAPGEGVTAPGSRPVPREAGGPTGTPAPAPVSPRHASHPQVRGSAVTVPVRPAAAADAPGSAAPVGAASGAPDAAAVEAAAGASGPVVASVAGETAGTAAGDGSAATGGEQPGAADAAVAASAADDASDAEQKPAGTRRPTARAGRTVARPTAKKPRWTRGKIIALSVVSLLVVVAVALIGSFGWLRWFSADDAADLRGTWYLAGTSTPIIITDDRIHLTEDVSYKYTLDTHDKTIQFTFGNLAGSGRYRFSLDRNELALVDGAFSGGDTLGEDIGWTIHALWENLLGQRLAPAEKSGKGVTLLSRTPAATAPSLPSDADDDTGGEGDAMTPDGGAVADGDAADAPTDALPDDDGMAVPDDKGSDGAAADDAAARDAADAPASVDDDGDDDDVDPATVRSGAA